MRSAASSRASKRARNVPKVLILGLDGATLDLMRPWAEAGQLPALKGLMDRGAWGPLESTVPPMTSPAWPSFATGMYPAKHGVFDFVSAHSGSFNIVNATAVRAPVLWELLSAHDKHVGVINVPVTYPPRPVNGFMISGLLSPSGAEVTYPADLLQRYDGQAPAYRVMPSIQYKPGNEGPFLDDLESLIEVREQYALRLMQDQPWDMFMVHFLSTDLAQHALWRYMDPTHPRFEAGSPYKDAIARIYRRVDRAIGALLARAGDETTTIVMSDHGFGPLHGVVNLNILLWQQGLLHFKRDPLTRLRAVLFRYGLTPKLAYRLIERLNLQNLVARLSKSTRNAAYNKFLSFDDVDWTRTAAYSLGHVGQIYINVAGRERHGIVPRGAAYEEAIERVIEALGTLTRPDGHPLVDRVIRTVELPGGPYADDGPDLHLILDGYRYISCPLFATDGYVLSRQIRGDSGSHRMEGTFIAAGPQIRLAGRVEGTQIVDLAPTVLSLLGCPVPEEMDGHVLSGLLTAGASAHDAARAREAMPGIRPAAVSLSPEEETELQQRLRGLGYLG
jgi:predicted AlkP superfamily phosphohydrolase/phosphomutase